MRAVFAAIVTFGLASAPATAQAPRDGGTLRMGIQSEPRSLDPLLVITDGATGHIVSNIFNTLVRYDEKMDVVPDLAASWQIGDGGKTVTFALRSGVKFHDGTDFNAEAVKFAFDRIADPANASPYRQFFAPVKAVTAVDPLTVKIEFSEPWPGFFYQLLYVGGMGIPSPTAVKKLGNEGFARQPVGTGPYKLAEWRQGDHITLEKNTAYFRAGLPHIDRIEFMVIPEATALMTNLRTGQVELVRDIEAPLLRLVNNDPNLQVVVKSAYTFDWLALNEAKPPFNDKRVRQAVNMAIDRKALATAVYGPEAKPATAQITSANKFHAPNTLPTFAYDPEKAKQLLREAGVPNLQFTLYASTVKPQLGQLATIIQAQLAKIGVTAKTEVLEHQAWLSNVLKERAFEASTVAGTGGPEPSSYVSFWSSASPINFVSMKNPELDALLAKARSAQDENERRTLYYRIQEIGADEASWMALAEAVSVTVESKKLQGYVPLPYNVSYFESAWLLP